MDKTSLALTENGKHLATLSKLARKRRIFETDTYFIEGMDELLRTFSAGSAIDFAMSHSVLIAKPEAVVTRSLGEIVEWLTTNRFSVIWLGVIRFNRHMTRALWAHHWNAVSEAHREFVDQLVESTPSLAFVVRDQSGVSLPCSVRLSAGKGPADPKSRTTGQLRYAIAQPNHLLNAVHTPDEPADVVRELAVLLDGKQFKAVIHCAVGGELADGGSIETALADIYRETPEESLGLVDVLADINRGCPGLVMAGELMRAILEKRLQCDELFRDFADHGAALRMWQRLAIAAYTTISDRPGARRFIPSAGFREWGVSTHN